MNENTIEGRNVVIEAFRSGAVFEKLYIQKELRDGAINTIVREAKKRDVYINYVDKSRLDDMSKDKKHQGVIAILSCFEYSSVEDILNCAKEKNEDPFIFILDQIEDPHNLGAIIRTANVCGAHGVIIKKHNSAGLSATAVKASAGAVLHTKVAKVTNISNTVKELKNLGLWFVSADMDGEVMYNIDMRGPIGVIIGNEGKGVSELVKKNSDFIASIPMKGEINSLNASVAAAVLAYEIVRQRFYK